MRWTQEQSLQAALIYSSLFNYPLTVEEVRRYAIFPIGQVFSPYTEALLKKYTYKNYIVLPENQHDCALRDKRRNWSTLKWNSVEKYMKYLKLFPTVKMIGISGSLSMDNADKNDDIDLFFICAPKSIWITRLYVLFLLGLLRKRRTYGNNSQKDLFCPNMFVTTETMTVPPRERDLYCAHEIVQLKCVWSLNTVYQEFLKSNVWAAKFLPNAYEHVKTQSYIFQKETNTRKLLEKIVILLNKPAKTLQLLYMKKHITSEIISDYVLRFHPKDARLSIRKKFILLLQQKNIPLDSRFF